MYDNQKINFGGGGVCRIAEQNRTEQKMDDDMQYSGRKC